MVTSCHKISTPLLVCFGEALLLCLLKICPGDLKTMFNKVAHSVLCTSASRRPAVAPRGPMPSRCPMPGVFGFPLPMDPVVPSQNVIGDTVV